MNFRIITNNKNILGTIFLMLAAMLYGLEPVVAKSILAHNNFMQVQFMRCGIAAILLLPFLMKQSQGLAKIKKRQIFNILLLGFLGMGLASSLFYFGLKLTTGLSAILIERSYPFLVFILAYFFLKERVAVKKISGAILIMLGVLLIILPGFQTAGIMIGNLFILGAMIIWAFWIILAKFFVKDINPIFLAMSGFVMGLLAAVTYLKGNIIPIFTLPMFTLGIIVALSWFLYFKGLQYITSIKATLIESTAPFFTAIFTILILMKIPNVYEIIAMFLVISGLLFLVKEK